MTVGQRIAWHPGARRAGIAVLLALVPLGTFFLAVWMDSEASWFAIVLGMGTLILGTVKPKWLLYWLPIQFANPFPLGERAFVGNLANFTMALVTASWFFRSIGSGWQLKYPTKYFAPVLVVVVSAFASLAVTRWVGYGFQESLRYAGYLIVLFLFVYHTIDSVDDIQAVVRSLIIGGTIAAALGLFEFAWQAFVEGERVRASGWLGGSYGAVVGSSMVLSIVVLLHDPDARWRLVAAIAVPLTLGALIASQTRAWVGATGIALFILFGMLGARARVRIIVYTVVATAVLWILVALVSPNLEVVTPIREAVGRAFYLNPVASQRNLEEMSMWMRLNVWRVAGTLFLAHPLLGIGIGTLRFQNYITGELGQPGVVGVGFVDNQFIQFFAELGVLAGIAWAVYIFRIMVAARRSVSRAGSGALRVPAEGIFGALIVYVAGSFFWTVATHYNAFAVMMIIIGTLAALERTFDAAGERERLSVQPTPAAAEPARSRTKRRRGEDQA